MSSSAINYEHVIRGLSARRHNGDLTAVYSLPRQVHILVRFYPRESRRYASAGIIRHRLSVRPSVCLSVTRRYHGVESL